MELVIGKIKDFFYYISDLVLAIIIMLLIAISFYFNISGFFTNVFGNNPMISISKITSQNTVVADETANKDENQNLDIQEKTVSITIPQSSISAQVVDILYDNQLIQSKEEAMDHIRANNLDGKLKSGNFTMNTKMSVKDIFIVLSK